MLHPFTRLSTDRLLKSTGSIQQLDYCTEMRKALAYIKMNGHEKKVISSFLNAASCCQALRQFNRTRLQSM